MSNDAGRVAAADGVAATHTGHNQGVTRFNYIVIAQLILGPNVAALEWSKEATAYINDTYKPVQPVKLYQPLFGELNKVTWSMEFENLAAYEAFMSKLENDDGYRARILASRKAGIFVLSTLSQMMYRQLA